MHDLIRHPPGGNPPRPANDTRRADAPFHHRVVKTIPRTCRTAPGPPHLRAIVSAPDENRIPFNPESLDRIEHKAGLELHVRHRVPDVACAGLPGKVRMRERGEVYLSDRIVEEEWSFRLHVALHKSDAALGRLAVERAPGVEVEHLHLARRLAGLAFPDIRRFH